jgi:hypothetical protein
MQNLWKAIESAWRAGLKQFRRMRTMQARENLPDPFKEAS